MKGTRKFWKLLDVSYIDYDYGIKGVYIYQSLLNVYIEYVQFYQLYLIKVVLKKSVKNYFLFFHCSIFYCYKE